MITNLQKKSTQKFYNRTIQKSIKKRTVESKMKTVVVLIEEVNFPQLNISKLAYELELKSTDFKVLVYKEFDKKTVVSSQFFSKKEFGFRGSLKSDNLKNFVKYEADLLINYTTQPNLYLNVLTLLSEAKFKVGFATIDDRLFDLVIAESNFDIETFNQEIHKYLTILNKI